MERELDSLVKKSEEFDEGDIVKITILDEMGCHHRYGVHIGKDRIAHLTYDRLKDTAMILCESKKRFQGGSKCEVTKVSLKSEEDGGRLQHCKENDGRTTATRAVSLITQVKGIDMMDIPQVNKSQAFATWCRFSTDEFFARDSGFSE